MKFIVAQLICVAAFLFQTVAGATCNRKPMGATGDRSLVDEGFQIYIEGNPTSYIRGQQYNVSLVCASGLKFTSFTLIVESEHGSLVNAREEMVGHFEIVDIAETKFSTLCENMIESTNGNTKSRVDVAWVAPTHANSSCVFIRAAILQERHVWFSDDGALSKSICPEIDEINSQTVPVNPCCACDEAKYDVRYRRCRNTPDILSPESIINLIVLERTWSRNTHAKDFPNESWRTRFSELIGASHSLDYNFWQYQSHASLGLRELAEHGSTRSLEAEIKAIDNKDSIRTIIRAPGIMYRHNVKGTTFATVRVDPTHHVISFVSKIQPSPDWILGVAGLELCLANCTWIEYKKLNLYPWDIGTDAGPSYMSPDQPQVPPDVVRRITSSFPSDHRSPFYDETGAAMKPLAALHITRRKIYERECDFEESVDMECATHPWNNWSECTTRCGAGTQYRTRVYKDADLAASYNCHQVLRQSQTCMGTVCGVPETDTDAEGNPGWRQTAECELTQWGAWSPCSKRCGRGYTTRTRALVNPHAQENCLGGTFPIELEQKKVCNGVDCGGSIKPSYNSDSYDDMNQMFEPNSMVNENVNIYESSTRRNPNRRPQFGGRFQEQNRQQYVAPNARDPYMTEEQTANLNLYENEQNRGMEQNREYEQNRRSETNRRLDANRQTQPSGRNELSSRRDYSEDRELPEDSSNIYGSEKLVGHNEQGWNNLRNQQSTTEKPQQNLNFRNNNFRIQQNNRQSHVPPSVPTNRQQIRPGTEMDTNNGIHETFDEYGRKVLIAQSDPNDYHTVQNYCLKKPISYYKPCKRENVTILNYWFYDAEDRECKLFTSNDCDGNKNKFRTLDACEGICHRPIMQSFAGQAGQDGGGTQYGDIETDELEENRSFGVPQSQVKPGLRRLDYGGMQRGAGGSRRRF